MNGSSVNSPNPILEPYSIAAPLVAPRAAPPPSRIPSEALAAKADNWLGGTSNSPAPPSVPQGNNSAFLRQNYQNPLGQQQMQPSQQQSAYQQPQPQQGWDNRNSNGGNYMAPQYGQYGVPPTGYPQQPNYAPLPLQPPPGAAPQYQQTYGPPQPNYQQQYQQIPPQMQQQQQPLQQMQPPQLAPYYNPNPPRLQTPSINPQSVVSSPQPQQTPLSLSSLSLNPSNPQPQRRSLYPSPEEAPPNKLAVTHPDQKMLAAMRETALAGGGDNMQKKVAWAKQVLKYIERHQSTAGESSRINDPTLVRWTDEALGYILSSAASSNPVPLALYLRGDLSSSGSFPSYRTKDPKSAFRDFEAAANAGYEKAWFRIGRAYEDFGDVRRAVGAYERGIEKGDCGSTYRLAMAYLLGQIGLTPDSGKAIALLKRAADTADLDTPQPPYILGMILSGEFESPAVQIKKDVVPIDISEAKWRIERAAYLSFGPAQYKMGFSYEYATLGCLFDPLLSVQYYALASQNGEVEADMALSKWYLVGSEGNFEKDEGLAFTFAEKAASRQLPSAEFALGYFTEVGINGMKNLEQAKRWYARAAGHGNVDARDRLQALSESEGNVLNRADHESHVDSKLTRKRTQAEARSNEQRERIAASNLAASLSGQGGPSSHPQRVSSAYQTGAQQQQPQQMLRRQNTRKAVEAAVGGRGTPLSIPPQQQRPLSTASAPLPPRPPQQNYRPAPSPAPSMPPASVNNNRSRPSQAQNVQEIAVAPARPSTFAEMGIATQKAKKDECLIM